MSPPLQRILTALCGILGVGMLITSFAINPGPPPNATIAQVMEFGKQYHDDILMGAWLQAVGSVLCITFTLAIVHLAGATNRFAGWMTMFGGTILAVVSLVETTFYLNAVNSDSSTVLISLGLIHAIQHAFSMVAAPAVFFPLGAVILGSRVLPRLFGLLALALGGAFAVLGLVALFSPAQSLVDDLSIVQGFWFLFAAITLLALRVGEPLNPSPARDSISTGAPGTALR